MIYFDHAATTPITNEVFDVMKNYFDYFGNPSSHYGIGFEAKEMINRARKQIADSINCEPENICFTSGGSEGDNWAIRSIRRPFAKRNRPIISDFEHHAVSYAAALMGEYKSLAVGEDGVIDPSYIEERLKLVDHDLYSTVSMMMVNNEIGTIQPVKELAELAHTYGYIFHTDAVQAVGHVHLDVKDLDVDMLTVSGHKFGCPKGIGFNYIKPLPAIRPFIAGGGQENGMRAGTENVPYIMAIAQAFETANKCLDTAYVKSTKDLLWDTILQEVRGVRLNGSMENRIDSNLNFCIKGIDAQQLVAMMDSLHDVCISTGSACNSGQASPSHVLKAIGLSDGDANSSIRITLGADNTWAECIQFVKYLKYDVAMMREE